jgi:thermitase
MSLRTYRPRPVTAVGALVLGALLAGSSAILVGAQPAPVDTSRGRPSVVADEVLVKFRPGARASDEAAMHLQARGQVVREVPAVDVKVVRVAGPAVQALSAYQRNPNVEYAEPGARQIHRCEHCRHLQLEYAPKRN